MTARMHSINSVWHTYLSTRDEQARNELVEHYAPLVQTQAARLSRKLPSQITYDEICSAGYDGLIEAIESYDPQRKAKFETFCQQRIIGAVMDWLRSLDPQSRTIRTVEKQRISTTEMLQAELGRRPTHDEIARRMQLDQDRYDQLSRISQLGREVHFSAMDARSGGEVDGTSNDRPWDVGSTKQDDPSAKLARSMLVDFITKGLSREERLVLTLYYYENLTMAEIGAVLELSESRVSQIHKEVIRRLQIRYRDKTHRDQLVA
jgi:RNA polymerase sigma factor for flagellar operon FliA